MEVDFLEKQCNKKDVESPTVKKEIISEKHIYHTDTDSSVNQHTTTVDNIDKETTCLYFASKSRKIDNGSESKANFPDIFPTNHKKSSHCITQQGQVRITLTDVFF